MNVDERLKKELQDKTGLYKWIPSEEYQQEVRAIRRKGRPKGSKNAIPTDVYDTNLKPRTPFEALRIILKLSRTDWAEKLDISKASIAIIERGAGMVNISILKRMQEEARKLGVSVTLDELVMHVVPWGMGEEEEKKDIS